MFLTSTIRLTFFDRALHAQCSVKKSQSKCGSQEHLKILPYNIMALNRCKKLDKWLYHCFHNTKGHNTKLASLWKSLALLLPLCGT